MHEMLAIYDVLMHILSYSQQRDLAAAARVSRVWSDVALDCLWREIESVLPLVEILFPLVETDDGEWSFTRSTPRQNWERFQYYARRIRHLGNDDLSVRTRKRDAQYLLLSELPVLIAAERPGNEPLLPMVQAISWSVSLNVASLQLVFPFISPSLKLLTLNLGVLDPRANGDLVRQFFDRLAAFPELRLERVNFIKYDAEVSIMKPLSYFLKHQNDLKVLELSGGKYLEPRVVQAVLFQNLPVGLREITTEVEFHNKTDYMGLIQTIVQRLPRLQVLKLFLTSLGSWAPSNFENLSPFLQNPNLEELTLWGFGEIQLNTGDIYALGRAFAHMKRLNLRRAYSTRSAVQMQASSLADFARAFPNLRTLTLHIPSMDISLPHRSTNDEVQVHPFNSTFKLLDVGASPLAQEDVPRMVDFLGMLCRHPLFEIKCAQTNTAARAWKETEELIKRANSVSISLPCASTGKSIVEVPTI